MFLLYLAQSDSEHRFERLRSGSGQLNQQDEIFDIGSGEAKIFGRRHRLLWREVLGAAANAPKDLTHESRMNPEMLGQTAELTTAVGRHGRQSLPNEDLVVIEVDNLHAREIPKDDRSVNMNKDYVFKIALVRKCG